MLLDALTSLIFFRDAVESNREVSKNIFPTLFEDLLVLAESQGWLLYEKLIAIQNRLVCVLCYIKNFIISELPIKMPTETSMLTSQKMKVSSETRAKPCWGNSPHLCASSETRGVWQRLKNINFHFKRAPHHELQYCQQSHLQR